MAKYNANARECPIEIIFKCDGKLHNTKSPFNYAKNVQIQGHLSSENCLLLNPLKWVLSMEHFGLWLNECLTRLETDLNRGFF